MAYFRYKLIETTGHVSSGILHLPYDRESTVVAYLECGGNTVLFVKRLHAVFSAILDLLSFGSRRRVSRKEMAEFLSNLSVMLRSGMPIVPALRELQADADNPAMAAAAEGMLFYVEAGASLADAASHYKQIFSNTVRYLITIGQETGTLDRTLKDASEHLLRVDRIVSDTKQALLYPSFVFVSMGVATVFWFYYVVPKIVGLFKEMDVALPAITLALLAISQFLQDYFAYLAAGLVLAIVGITAGVKKSQRFRKGFDATLLRLPVLRDIIASSNLAFVSEYLRLLLNAGVDTFRSLEILTDAVKNEVYRGRLVTVRSSMANGQGVADSFRAAAIFPSFVIRMVGVGEQSGTLPEQLSYVAEEYRSRLAVLVATIGKIIEPIVLIIAGILFGVIVAGLFLPIYDLIGKIA